MSISGIKARGSMKSQPGPPMTLGNAAAARVRLIVWCKACSHQVEPDPRRACAPSRRGDNRSRVARAARRFPVRQRQRRHGGDRDRAAVERAETSKPQFWLAADRCGAFASACRRPIVVGWQRCVITERGRRIIDGRRVITHRWGVVGLRRHGHPPRRRDGQTGRPSR
jgi:hypothetical protein